MRLAYVDCFSGASGDMLLGACLDCGLPLEELKQALAGLSLGGYDLRSEQVRRGGLRATKVHVDVTEKEQPHRRLADVLTIVDGSSLSDRVKDESRRVFRALAAAEAAVHGTAVESVHFHEVGAVDAIVDVVGTVAALERLGVARLECSALTEGTGWVESAHGRLPVPVPATTQLIRGVPVRQVEAEGELLTPTGAALLVTLAERFGPFPQMRVESVGYGAGSRDPSGHPNVLRLFVGETEEAWLADEVVVLETNLDDASGEILGHLSGLLLEEGALDVFVVSIQMKKQRPGVLLTVLASPEKARALERMIFTHTGTFGIRWKRADRHVLAREHEVVETEFGLVRIKVGRLGSDVVVRAPEYEDCARLAEINSVPLRSVYDAAQAAARKLRGAGVSRRAEGGA